MKNFITGLLVAIAIIVVIVLVKRLVDKDGEVINDNQSDTSGFDMGVEADLNVNSSNGDTLPQ